MGVTERSGRPKFRGAHAVNADDVKRAFQVQKRWGSGGWPGRSSGCPESEGPQNF